MNQLMVGKRNRPLLGMPMCGWSAMQSADILLVNCMGREGVRFAAELVQSGLHPRQVDTVASALTAVHESVPDLIMILVGKGSSDCETFCSDVRGHPRFSFVPMFVVLESADDSLCKKALEHGVADVSVFPPDLELLCLRMQYHINLKHQVETIQYRVGHDGLTGLPNRELLNDRLQQALSYAERYERKLAVAFIDLDRFKEINDTLGHAIGDEVLVAVSQRLQQCIRESDTVARLGGDEFVMILYDQATEDVTLNAMQRILKSINEPIVTGKGELNTSCSIGFSFYPQDGHDPETLIRHADAAMYRAKSLGRNNFQFFTTELTRRMNERLELEEYLRAALSRDEFHLVYQPRADLASGRLTGVEALLRWHHPRRGILRPGQFLSLAEEIGITPEIGRQVLRAACQQQVAWKRAGLADVPVSVNVSAKQLLHTDFVRHVREVIAETGIESRRLEIEMTEKVAMTASERTLEIMTALRAVGVMFSIDDFGAQFTCLNFLKRCPLTYIKLDPTFVEHVTNDAHDLAVTSAMISMAHSLNMHVVAEGVENAAQVSLLADRGCDAISGSYVCATQEAEHIGQLLARTLPPIVLPHHCSSDKRNLLLVDDETLVLAALERNLRANGYQILKAHGASEAFEILATHSVGVIVCDQQMPMMSGVEFLGNVNRMYPDTVRIILTANANLDAVMDAINIGSVYKFLHKPWDRVELCEIIEDAFRRHEALRNAGGSSLAAAS